MHSRDDKNVTGQLQARQPLLWLNPSLNTVKESLGMLPYQKKDILDAAKRLERFAPLIAQLFPETAAVHGIIESPLLPVPHLAAWLAQHGGAPEGKLWIKADHALPIAGSVKARGGIYEVLCFAEQLALEKGMLRSGDNYTRLAAPEVRELFSHYTVTVGSTGNLGLSIGVTGAALGFKTSVHMSADAKEWKKERLRKRGVTVIEHQADYARAVAAGRDLAARDPLVYFVDDEHSPRLLLGYSVAALRLQQQLRDRHVPVDAQHPLFIYIPCGVGGAPAGITLGLKTVFGDAAHCFYIEPVESPCMLLALLVGPQKKMSVHDIGLTNKTAADGLAVGLAAELAAEMSRPLVSGCATVTDDDLFRFVCAVYETEKIKLEPSAIAGLQGVKLVGGDPAAQACVRRQGLAGCMANANHIIWTTGGSLVPEEEFNKFLEQGRRLQ
jgi:D-serine dehydratase